MRTRINPNTDTFYALNSNHDNAGLLFFYGVVDWRKKFSLLFHPIPSLEVLTIAKAFEMKNGEKC